MHLAAPAALTSFTTEFRTEAVSLLGLAWKTSNARAFDEIPACWQAF
jgi:predicted transcriptional regulator YdeE